jgi:hypothetical protein
MYEVILPRRLSIEQPWLLRPRRDERLSPSLLPQAVVDLGELYGPEG